MLQKISTIALYSNNGKQIRREWKFWKKALNSPHKKIAPEKLLAYVEKHHDAYQREMAEEFDCSVTAIQKALKSLGFT